MTHLAAYEEHRAVRIDIRRAIELLPVHERQAVLLFVDGFTQQESAARMDCTQRTISNYLSRARAKLKRLFLKRPLF